MRYVDPEGVERYGEVDGDGRVSRLEGDPWAGDLRATGEAARVARWLAPVRPAAILCVGLNYRKHAEETGAEIPKYPVLFMKSPGAVQDPGGAIRLPRKLRSGKVDYEGELAVVIGRPARDVPKERAMEVVAGYTCANDVSARDWQKHGGGGQWCRGKTFDTFCPLGPVVATPEALPDPGRTWIRTTVSGEVMQEAETADMIFGVGELVEFLSADTTLLPGTVILTGTPAGVGMGRTPYRWLEAGDSVEVEIGGIGVLRNGVE
jgi:2-keto-4-pentenoate hydratase/2-oxohepta-3-ene-1,7-dioic acid hydratase in catechol pathway